MRAVASAILVIGIAVVVVGGATLIPKAIEAMNDAGTQRERAKTERIEAQADADHQASVDWQHEMMVWTTALAAFTGGFTLKDFLMIVFIGVAAWATGYWLGGKV